ncbi:NAD(P)H-binding protein [Altererythrobacter sp. ZODW24]|uniref:NAD(P)H-binding protein n=1 Tax=Altererythrobacter sp. ZODW24 TaxID=2185142 RepID=UPI000DF75956|nr:NAD(P)H-binding protein [Altererythrobacter sp. ZODW24]
MSDQTRIALVGATGLIGTSLIKKAVGRADFRIVAIARNEMALPPGARMEVLVAPTEGWNEALAAASAPIFACALGTTWSKAGQDEEAFRAVDEELVLDNARAAKEAGAEHAIVISSVGADPMTSNFYLRVKGEVERELRKIGFKRLDIIRPGLLRGQRSNDRRILERLGIMASPFGNLFLQGEKRKYRAIDAETVAEAMLFFAGEKAGGKFVHENDAIHRAASKLDRETPISTA